MLGKGFLRMPRMRFLPLGFWRRWLQDTAPGVLERKLFLTFASPHLDTVFQFSLMLEGVLYSAKSENRIGPEQGGDALELGTFCSS